MRKYLTGAGIIGISLIVAVSTAQKPQAPKKVVYKGKAYLAGGTIRSGKISKKQFDSLIALPLIAKDTTNAERSVSSFSFTYAERGVYEDSTGTPRIMTDYYATESEQGKLPVSWVTQIRSRTKEGDTVFYLNVMGIYPDSLHSRFHAEPIKLVLTE